MSNITKLLVDSFNYLVIKESWVRDSGATLPNQGRRGNDMCGHCVSLCWVGGGVSGIIYKYSI